VKKKTGERVFRTRESFNFVGTDAHLPRRRMGHLQEISEEEGEDSKTPSDSSCIRGAARLGIGKKPGAREAGEGGV